MLEAGRRLTELGAPRRLTGQLHGAELHERSAATAASALRSQGHDVDMSIRLVETSSSGPEAQELITTSTCLT